MSWPECRSLTFAWPLRLLASTGSDGQQIRTPAVSVGFLRRLLMDCPLGWHLTHLASSWPFSVEQASVIRCLGVEPIHAEHSLWMHDVPSDCFRQRRLR
jgi:hypothetical protein